MSTSRSHKRSFNFSRASSDFSWSSYSSSSTLALSEWFLTQSSPPPTKPWAVKALNQLGVKCKKSLRFGNGKKKGEEKEREEELHASPYDSKTAPFVLDISEESVESTKVRLVEEGEELDLLPDFPTRALRKASSSNVLSQSRSYHWALGRPGNQNGSTPDLSLHPNPFYLEELLDEFPKPPPLPGKVVMNSEEYTAREPVNPNVRRQGSNASFSMPTSTAYPGARTIKPKNLLERPVPKGMAIYRDTPSFPRKLSGRTQASHSSFAFPPPSDKS